MRILALAVAWLGLASVGVAAPIHAEVGDAGSLPPSAQEINDGGGPVTTILGNVGGGTEDMFGIYIANPAVFSANTTGSTFDTQLFLFDANGMGVLGNDDAGPGLLSQLGSFVGPPGVYYIAISSFDRDPTSAGGLIFPSFPFGPIYGPTGPGGGQPIIGWIGGSGGGDYQINLQGASHMPEPASLAAWGLVAGVGYSAYRLRRRKKAA